MQPYNNPDPKQPPQPYQGQPTYPPPANQPPPYQGQPPYQSQPGYYNGQQPYQGGPYPGGAPQPKKGGRGWLWILIGLVVVVALVVVLALAGVITGSVTVSTGTSNNVKSVTLAKGFKDDEAVNPTTTFSPSDSPIYSVVKLENTVANTRIKGVFTVVDANGEKDVLIADKELTVEVGRAYTANFSITLPRPWPIGQYKFELFINDKLEKTVNYTVQ